ncbi:hypothetical protein Enr13x_54810 [Stieleria neptunia]|uniref:Uncharacterized protein n=1 Tax=Stieleria neptunia TaxID=2527979 RepID=A0A518HXM0_9BACT|nr:hypothetical protein Enr13x_54810 [Stieleria neptunia]
MDQRLTDRPALHDATASAHCQATESANRRESRKPLRHQSLKSTHLALTIARECFLSLAFSRPDRRRVTGDGVSPARRKPKNVGKSGRSVRCRWCLGFSRSLSGRASAEGVVERRLKAGHQRFGSIAVVAGGACRRFAEGFGRTDKLSVDGLPNVSFPAYLAEAPTRSLSPLLIWSSASCLALFLSGSALGVGAARSRSALPSSFGRCQHLRQPSAPLGRSLPRSGRRTMARSPRSTSKFISFNLEHGI